jgi:small conductance mechanosensitive channel
MDSLRARAEHFLDRLMDLGAEYLPKVLLAAFTLFVGLWVIRVVSRVSERALKNSAVEPSVRTFLRSLGTITLKVLLFISVASMVGVATTSFVTVIGAAGLAVGLALQGSLSNFAGGVLILLLKPFKVGDTIEAQGHNGTVNAIQIFHTELYTGDNRLVIIPNGKLYNDVIVNLTNQPSRRVDVNVAVPYDSNISDVRRVLLEAVRELAGVLPEPAPLAEPFGFGEAGIHFTVRVWARPESVGPLGFQMHERIKNALDASRIPVALPQRQVRVLGGQQLGNENAPRS